MSHERWEKKNLQLPESTLAHSTGSCQWGSRMPPAFNSTIAPDIDLEAGKLAVLELT
jgi:hypothetical protein